MPLKILKQSADFEIKESTKQLIDYINENNHFNKNQLNLFYLNNPSQLEFLVSEIMLFYYIFGFSLSKELQEKFLKNFIVLIKQSKLHKDVFDVYSDIIDIEDINPHLTKSQIDFKKAEILKIKDQFSL
jgi:hypothetical protein